MFTHQHANQIRPTLPLSTCVKPVTKFNLGFHFYYITDKTRTSVEDGHEIIEIFSNDEDDQCGQSEILC